jgi:hypothetical protein
MTSKKQPQRRQMSYKQPVEQELGEDQLSSNQSIAGAIDHLQEEAAAGATSI